MEAMSDWRMTGDPEFPGSVTNESRIEEQGILTSESVDGVLQHLCLRTLQGIGRREVHLIHQLVSLAKDSIGTDHLPLPSLQCPSSSDLLDIQPHQCEHWIHWMV